MILVIDNFDSFTYNLVQLLRSTGAQVTVQRNDVLQPSELTRLKPAGIVVSPGPSHPSAIPQVGRFVEEAFALNIPVLGVCLGHQLLACVFGGDVVRAPQPVHGKPSLIHHDGAGILHGVSSPAQVARYHSLAIAEETMPRELIVSARSDDGVIMGIRHRTLPAEGVQFHPESILTPEGPRMLHNFVARCASASLLEVSA